MSEFLKKHKYNILILTAVLLFCVFPILIVTAIRGDDYTFHIQRIVALSEEIKIGHLRPRIYSTLLDGNGYASPLFYGDIFLLFPALLIGVLNVDVLIAWKFFNVLLFIVNSQSMYFCMKYITKNKKGAMAGTILFTISAYAGCAIMRRSAIGESLAMIFIPIAFCGLYDILYNKSEKWYLLAIGFSAIIYSHILSAFMTFISLFVFLIFSIDCFKQELLKKLKYILLSIVLCSVFTMDFIAPLFEQLQSSAFLATSGYSALFFGELYNKALPFWTIFSDLNQILIKNSYYPSGLSCLLVFIFIYVFRLKSIRDRKVEKFISISLIFLILTSKIFPWNLFQKYLGIIQFPWRFLMYATFFAAVAFAFYYKEMKIKSVSNILIILTIFSFVASSAVSYKNYIFNIDTFGGRELDYVNDIGTADYLPYCDELSEQTCDYKSYKKFLIDNSDVVFSDAKIETSVKREDDNTIIYFTGSDKEKFYIDAPLVMYKGYSAYLDDGTELACSYGKFGRIRVDVDGRTEGIISFKYKETFIQQISRLITAISIISFFVFLFVKKIKKNKEEVWR